MNLDETPPGLCLAAALESLSVTFRRMVAASDEHNCECHWGSARELALLKLPDVTLDPDLLHRTWQEPGWSDHAAVARRILPQFATALVGGLVRPERGFRGRWTIPRSRAVAAMAGRSGECGRRVPRRLVGTHLGRTGTRCPRPRGPGLRSRSLQHPQPMADRLGHIANPDSRPTSGASGRTVELRPPERQPAMGHLVPGGDRSTDSPSWRRGWSITPPTAFGGTAFPELCSTASALSASLDRPAGTTRTGPSTRTERSVSTQQLTHHPPPVLHRRKLIHTCHQGRPATAVTLGEYHGAPRPRACQK